jgi:hypothetical protein
MMASRCVRIAFMILSVSILTGIFVIYLKRRHDLNPFYDRTFIASVWHAEEARKDRAGRAVMAGDLIRNHLKRGMSDASVKALLGEPNKTWTPERKEQHDTYEYDMGYAAWDVAGQHNVLLLSFDNNGLFETADITQD